MSLIGHIYDLSKPPLIVAELSGNHHQCFDTAKRIIKLAAENGADAVKIQSYTADSITLPSNSAEFLLTAGLWEGRNLYELYQEASTPYEWHAPLSEYAQSLGIPLFSTPFDEDAVEFLESTINPEIYKISSFEVTHTPLLKRVAETGKPVVMSTGMANEYEIHDGVKTLKSNGCQDIVLLKCVSEYPSANDGFNLRSMTTLANLYNTQIGLSDHTLTNEVAMGATAMGARIIEKHFTNSREEGGIDAAFSLEPCELGKLVSQVHALHTALGSDKIGETKQDAHQLQFRRSIYVSKTIKKGEILSDKNLKIIRPSLGLPPKYWGEIIGKRASKELIEYSPLKLGDWVN
jgi:N-acetylneuraminate synthase